MRKYRSKINAKKLMFPTDGYSYIAANFQARKDDVQTSKTPTIIMYYTSPSDRLPDNHGI